MAELEELSILDNRYLIEQSVSFDKYDFSCWISPDYTIYLLNGGAHISFLLEHLGLFGFTEEYVNKLHKKYSDGGIEDLIVLNKVGDHLFMDAFFRGWIRVRDQSKFNNFSIEFHNTRIAEQNLCFWAKEMVQNGFGSRDALIFCWELDRRFKYKIKYMASDGVQLFQSFRRGM